MTGSAPILCSAQALPEGGDVPEWLHLLPASSARTVDGRGPYIIPDAAQLMAASMTAGKLPICVNHATDIAAPRGEASPARGWIGKLEQRADGIWGKVDWTGEGRRMVADREYRGISPVITHDKAGRITRILRASLTNVPNLEGLVALHSQEQRMNFSPWLVEAFGLAADAADDAIVAGARKVLGLAADADEDAIGAALKARLAISPDNTLALQSAMKPIATALGLTDTADAAAVLAGVQLLKTGDDNRFIALQSQLTTATGQIKTLTDDAARKDAVAFVDAAIAAGRVGVKPARDEYIAMHMSDAGRAKRLVDAMPILAPGKAQIVTAAVEGAPDSPALLSQKATAYHKKLAEAGTHISYAAAVRAVSEGKSA